MSEVTEIGARPHAPVARAPLPLRNGHEARTGGPVGAAAGRGLASEIGRALEHRRLFILLPFAMIAGIIVSRQVAQPPDLMALVAVQAVLMACLWPARARMGWLRGLALANAAWLGFGLLSVHGALFGTPMLSAPTYGTYSVRVDEVVSEAEDGSMRVMISAIVPAAERTRPVSFKRARLFLRQGTEVSAGDRIEAAIRFTPVPGPALPGAFDPQFHAYFDGVGAYGVVTSGLSVVPAVGDGGIERLVEWVRRTIGARIDAVLAQPAAGIARALITGDQSLISEEARDVLGMAGLAHVYSISGLHLTMVAGLVYWLVRFALALLPLPRGSPSVKAIAAVAGIVAALLYFSISGGNVAAQRATLMIVLVFGAVLAGRRALTMRNVAIAATIVVLIDPPTVFRPSFQLSFAAVIALIGAVELGAARRRAAGQTGLVRQGVDYFAALTMTSLVAGAATLLFSIYHFQQTSPLGVVGNLLVLPVVSTVMMPMALLAAVLMPLGGEALPLMAMGWSIDWMLWMAVTVSGWSAGFDTSPLLLPVALVIGLGALAWFAFLPGRWRMLGPVAAVPLVALLALDREPDVLIADSTQALMVQTASGPMLLAGRAGTFVADVWGETYSLEVGAMPKTERRCDSVACIATTPGGLSLALVSDPSGFADECGRVDLVLTRMEAPRFCREAGLVIDAGELARGGVHWIGKRHGTIEIRPAIADPGRPWRPGGN